MPVLVTRRQLIASALLPVAVSTRLAAPPPSDSLARHAARTGRYFGAAVRLAQLAAPSALQAALLLECSQFTPELEMKWAAIEPRRGELTLAALDDLATLAGTHGKKLHGHALLWHRSVPPWAEQALAAQRDWQLIRRLFASVIPRYGGTTSRWDVVNEPIDVGSRADGLRENVFLAAFGPDYIRRALDEARTFAPHAQLMINEYGLDYDIPVERDRRAALLRLLEGLVKAGAPLGAVGIQAHLDLAKGPFVERVFDDFLREIEGMGLRIAISELDVKEADYTASAAVRDQRVAELVGRYLTVALSHASVMGVTTWGLSDGNSWLEVTDADRARYPGAWRSGPGPGVNRGLPFDAAVQRKPMYRAIASAFRRSDRNFG